MGGGITSPYHSPAGPTESFPLVGSGSPCALRAQGSHLHHGGATQDQRWVRITQETYPTRRRETRDRNFRRRIRPWSRLFDRPCEGQGNRYLPRRQGADSPWATGTTRQRHGSNTGGASASPVFDSGAEASTDFTGHSVHPRHLLPVPNSRGLQIPYWVSACYGQAPRFRLGVRGLSVHRPRIYMQSSGKYRKTADRACLSAVVNRGKWWEFPP